MDQRRVFYLFFLLLCSLLGIYGLLLLSPLFYARFHIFCFYFMMLEQYKIHISILQFAFIYPHRNTFIVLCIATTFPIYYPIQWIRTRTSAVYVCCCSDREKKAYWCINYAWTTFLSVFVSLYMCMLKLNHSFISTLFYFFSFSIYIKRALFDP